MSKYQPPGRLSKVTGQDYIIQIQTEFGWTPHPRVTTSVILDGVLIHKIQKNWDHPLETQEERDNISRFINKQHGEVEKIVESNQEFILNYGKTEHEEYRFEGILEIEGIQRAFLLSSDGLLTPFSDEEIEIEKTKLFESLFELVEFLDLTTKWGGLDEAYLILDEERIMIFRYKKNYLITVLDQTASTRETARRVVEFIKAA